MSIYRSVISIFLLLSYSIGFAHGLVPHSQENANGVEPDTDNYDQFHQHKQHSHDQIAAIAHFEHLDHCDDNMLDLLICLMDDTEHPCAEENAAFYTPSITGNTPSNKYVPVNIIAVLIAVFTDSGEDEDLVRSNFGAHLTQLFPPLFDAPFRGPPTVSC